ncbi:MAG: outer membrane lipoprotein carrier protein LolA, partial [Nitrospirota bacterium]
MSVMFVLPALAADGPVDEKALQEVRDVVKQLQARYEKMKDLQADFSQKTKIEGFERPVTSSGKVYIKK